MLGQDGSRPPMSGHGTTLQYLVLIGFSSILSIGADRAFGSGSITRPVEPVTLKSTRRGAVAASFQLRGERVAKTLGDEIAAAEASAQRWLTEGSWLDPEELKSAAISEDALAGNDRVIERVATPLSEIEIVGALRKGHQLAFSEEPTESRLGVAWAHIALENNRGREFYCNNFGNLGATDAWEGKYFVRLLKERVQRNPDVWKFVTVRFRAFATPEEGARDYWRVLADHYRSALARFDSGLAFDAAKLLSGHGYATALAEPYAMGVARLHQEWRGRIFPQLETD